MFYRGGTVDRATIIDEVKKIFKDNVGEKSDLAKIYSGEPLKKISVIDSLAMLNIVVALEKKFNIKFNIASLDEVFNDINSISDYIISKKVKK